VVARTDASGTVRYAHRGPGDSPSATLDDQDVPVEATVALAGGAVLTRRFVVAPPLAVTDVWSYPDVGGHTAATATYAGSLLGLPVLVGTTSHSYTPDGTGPPPDNSDGDYDYGWLGSHQRPTDHGLPTTVVQMGARPYAPSLGRFLSVDPIEAGSCNDYDYVCGDPVNGLDLTGTKKKSKEPLPDLEAHCGYNAPNDIFYGGECLHYRTAKANDDGSIYSDFVSLGRRYDQPDQPNGFFTDAATILSDVQVVSTGAICVAGIATAVGGIGIAAASVSCTASAAALAAVRRGSPEGLGHAEAAFTCALGVATSRSPSGLRTAAGLCAASIAVGVN
jgi:RHS repeat-associated protein